MSWLCGCGFAAISDVENGNGTPDPENLLIGAKALALSKLTYTSDCEEGDKLKKSLAARDVKDWFVQLYDNDDLPNCILTKMVGSSIVESDNGTRAITGVLNNITDKLSGETLVVSFRGTSCTAESLANLNSFRPTSFVTKLGNEIGSTGRGIMKAYKKLAYTDFTLKNTDNGTICKTSPTRKHICLLEYVATNAQFFSNGVLICGHSLGGGMAQLLAAELNADYPKLFPIRLVTFGSPRGFDYYTATRIHRNPYTLILRFVNEGDFVATIGGQGFLSTFGYNVLGVIGLFVRLPSVRIPDYDLCKDEEDEERANQMQLIDIDEDADEGETKQEGDDSLRSIVSSRAGVGVRGDESDDDAMFSRMIAASMKVQHSQSMKANLYNLAHSGTTRKTSDTANNQIMQRQMLLKAVRQSIRQIDAQTVEKNCPTKSGKETQTISFYHYGTTIYLPGGNGSGSGSGSGESDHNRESAGWMDRDITQTDDFDWCPMPRGTTVTEGAALYSFLCSGINQHLLDSDHGYFDRLCSSQSFKHAVTTLSEGFEEFASRGAGGDCPSGSVGSVGSVGSSGISSSGSSTVLSTKQSFRELSLCFEEARLGKDVSRI